MKRATRRDFRPELWERVKALFEACADLTPAERAALLARESDGWVREEAAHLLWGYDQESHGGMGGSALVSLTSDLPRTLGRYRVVRELGRGGMARVFAAVLHEANGFARPVAIKGILPEFANHPEALALFQYEAQLTSLDHPNIVTVREYFEAAGAPYLVMDYVAGKNLHEVVEQARASGRMLRWDLLIRILTEVCNGLHYAYHGRNGVTGEVQHLVHRDVSSRNIMISYEGDVKLVDFGIAKAGERTALTRPGEFRGTVKYMAPELLTGAPATHSSDLFALAVILREMLLEPNTVFPSDLVGLGEAGVDEDPGSTRSKLPPGESVERIVAKGTHPDPSQRYANASELQTDLLRLVDVQTPIELRRRFCVLMKDLFPVGNRLHLSPLRARSHSSLPPADFAAVPLVPVVSSTPSPAVRGRRASGIERLTVLLLVAAMLVCGAGIVLSLFPLSPAESEKERQAIVSGIPDTSHHRSLTDFFKKCTVNIRSEPSGALVEINQTDLAGLTPVTLLVPCHHSLLITVSKPGFREAYRILKPGDLGTDFSAHLAARARYMPLWARSLLWALRFDFARRWESALRYFGLSDD